jgi:hypothetical protein
MSSELTFEVEPIDLRHRPLRAPLSTGRFTRHKTALARVNAPG